MTRPIDDQYAALPKETMTVPLALAELALYVAEMRRLRVTRAGDIELEGRISHAPMSGRDPADSRRRVPGAKAQRRIVTGASGGLVRVA